MGRVRGGGRWKSLRMLVKCFSWLYYQYLGITVVMAAMCCVAQSRRRWW